MSRPSRGLLIAAVASAVIAGGCASESVEGGSVVSPGKEPMGDVVGRWKVTDCRDAQGAVAPDVPSTIALIEPVAGDLVLAESRSGFDTVLVTNHFSADGERVFQVSLASSSSKPVVREYRLPPTGTGFGRFSLVRRVVDWNRADNGDFAVKYEAAVLGCELTPAEGVPQTKIEPDAG